MEIAFDAIGIDVPNETAFHNLAENAEKKGEASLSTLSDKIVHGRCWRIGFGLEVWTILNESETGEILYADCRPAFRARYTQLLNNWTLSENKNEIIVEGFIENRTAKISFQLQNLTEISRKRFEQKTLRINLCGLAYRAEIVAKEKVFWKPLLSEKSKYANVNWHLCGKILAFSELRNPFTNKDLYWIHVSLEDFDLEILVSQNALAGGNLKIGASIEADIWLQGHITGQSRFHTNYEGVDWSQDTSDFWKKFKRQN